MPSNVTEVKLVLVIVVCSCVCTAVGQHDVHIFISPHGNDQNTGNSETSPVKTFDRAMYKAWQTNKNTTVYIELMTGYHELDRPIVVSRDNMVIRSYQKSNVHVLGGRQIPNIVFKRVSDPAVLARLPPESRTKVYVAHLPDLNITNYGTITPYGTGKHRQAPLEVFFNGHPLRLAQWPNEGFTNILSIPDGQYGLRFRYNSTISLSWANENDPWVYGYWYWGWSDRAIKVTSLDTSSMMVTLAEPALYGLRTGHWEDKAGGWDKQGGYFRFINILSALDQPGEYYMDREHGNLYVWIPTSDGSLKQSDIIYVSLVDTCIQINNGVQNVIIEDFTLEACRGYGIHGTNSNNVNIYKMELRNIGGVAVFLSEDSRKNVVSQCYIHDTAGGIFIHGGDRPTLESSGNIISHNDIVRYSRVGAVGVDAINVLGVGHLVQHNHVKDGQYSGIKYYGNDIIMEYNMIEYVCMTTSDCGAFHTGKDWTTRGNIIRSNLVHDTLRRVPGMPCRAVMLDDQSSSTSIMFNVFYNNDVHVNIGGGRDNVVVNNVIYNATSYNLEVDNRGVTHKFDKELYQRLHAVPYKSSLWTLRYPDLINFDFQNADLPEGNQIYKNVVYNGPTTKYIDGDLDVIENAKFYNITETEFSLGPTDHYNVSIGDFRVKCDVAVWANMVNFRQVPSPHDVGPMLPTGPTYMHRSLEREPLSPHSTVCPTKAPAGSPPVPAYLPDGSRHNTFYNTSKQGCWLDVTACTNHPTGGGLFRDTYGEKYEHAGESEELCFRRAVIMWKYCGAQVNEQVAAIYAPTGAMTLAGDGCFMAWYGCPLHGGPADGHAVTSGHLERATWVEQHVDGAHNESQCLSFAVKQWKYCGSSRNHPFTFIYRPTGAVVTAGAGCWIHVQNCPKHPEYKSMFYDALGATNYNTDDDELVCLHQAEYYWTQCGQDSRYPVTARYRPTTARKTYPAL